MSSATNAKKGEREMSISLYKLAGEIARIHEELGENGGELTDDIEQRLDAARITLKDKVLGIARWSRALDVEEDAIKSEYERLGRRLASKRNLNKRIKDYALGSLEKAGIQNLDDAIISVAVQLSPPALHIKDEGVIPNEFWQEVAASRQLNKSLLKSVLNAGRIIEGAEITRGKNLGIR